MCIRDRRDGAQLDADDRIVQLSTCRSALTSDPVRYIVTAVLLSLIHI